MTKRPQQRQQPKPRKSTSKSKQPAVLASATIRVGDTNVAPEDLFNEPSRHRVQFGQDGDWIRMFDRSGSFLKSLMALLNNSPTLRRIIHDKASMAVGDGFIPHESDTTTLLAILQKVKKILGIEDKKVMELNEAIKRVNLHGESLFDVVFRVFIELFSFGNAIVEMVKTMDSDGKKQLYLYHVPLYMAAIKKAEKDLLIKTIGIHENWERVGLKDDEIRELPLYPKWSKDDNGDERCAIHLKEYAPGFFYWGLPEWIAAKLWTEVEYRIPKYNITKFQNGFVPSAIVQLFGSVSQEEAQDIIKKLTDKFTDTGNNHKIFAQVLRDESLKANVQKLSEEGQGEYLELQKLAAQAIVTANRWTMSLAGFATSGKLGTNQQIRQETEYVQNTVIKPKQNMVLARIVNPFIKEAGAWMNASWREVSLSISNSTPVSFMGELEPENNLTINEKREVLGYEPLDEEGLGMLMEERKSRTPSQANNNPQPVEIEGTEEEN